MLGQIANYCPIISRNTIVKNSTSISSIWQSIRLHYGFQSTGGHFLDFNNIHLEANERPDDLYQRLASLIEDNLLRANGNIQQHGEAPEVEEELSPPLKYMLVLTWLRFIHRELPNLVKQRYGTELRSQTLASLKPEISQALGSLLDEIHSAADAKVLRASLKESHLTDPRSVQVVDPGVQTNIASSANKQVARTNISWVHVNTDLKMTDNIKQSQTVSV
jgi:hypothetical protein